MKCKHCGEEITNDSVFCEFCGKKVIVANTKKKILWFVLAIGVIVFAVVFLLGEVREEIDNTKYNVSLSLNKDALALDEGTCDTLIATVTTTPDISDVNVSVSFASDNANVAQVDNNGLVRAVAKGETTITVVAWSPKGTTDTAKVRVIVNEIVLPELNPNDNVQSYQEPKKQGKGNQSGTPSKTSPSIISFGTLDGSMSYDNNATIKVTKQHTIQLKDTKRNTITIYPGDELRQCRIRKGVLESFQIIRQNGNRQSIIDSQEKLN